MCDLRNKGDLTPVAASELMVRYYQRNVIIFKRCLKSASHFQYMWYVFRFTNDRIHRLLQFGQMAKLVEVRKIFVE